MPKGSVTMCHNSFSMSLYSAPPPGSPRRSISTAYLRVGLYYIDLCKVVCEESRVNGRVMAESERRKRPSHYVRIGGHGRDLMNRVASRQCLPSHHPVCVQVSSHHPRVLYAWVMTRSDMQRRASGYSHQRPGRFYHQQIFFCFFHSLFFDTPLEDLSSWSPTFT